MLDTKPPGIRLFIKGYKNDVIRQKSFLPTQN